MVRNLIIIIISSLFLPSCAGIKMGEYPYGYLPKDCCCKKQHVITEYDGNRTINWHSCETKK